MKMREISTLAPITTSGERPVTSTYLFIEMKEADILISEYTAFRTMKIMSTNVVARINVKTMRTT
jgi:hypothetical protein